MYILYINKNIYIYIMYILYVDNVPHMDSVENKSETLISLKGSFCIFSHPSRCKVIKNSNPDRGQFATFRDTKLQVQCFDTGFVWSILVDSKIFVLLKTAVFLLVGKSPYVNHGLW